MIAPSLSAIAAEIRTAHEQLTGMVSAGAFDDAEFDVEHDMASLAEKLDTWANALELVGEMGK